MGHVPLTYELVPVFVNINSLHDSGEFFRLQASHFDCFSPTRLINSVMHEHSLKI